jgi:hypothetical protein
MPEGKAADFARAAPARRRRATATRQHLAQLSPARLLIFSTVPRRRRFPGGRGPPAREMAGNRRTPGQHSRCFHVSLE